MYFIGTSTISALSEGVIYVSTGAKLKELRGRKTQKEAAEGIGITKSALAMYERDERVPRDEVKIRIAKYYGVSVYSLFFDSVEHEKCTSLLAAAAS